MKNIKITEIECIDNRKMSGIEELAENIKSVGLLQPIILIASQENYQVVAGRRRFRALQHLGRLELQPSEYVVIEGAVDADRIAFCENFHRVNLTLAEEVEQLGNLRADNLTIKDLAALLGKTPEYVALRLNLANLSPEWKTVLENPAEYPQWTPGKLELIAKQPAEVQERYKNWVSRLVSVSEINDSLSRGYMALSNAPFKTDSCMDCPKTSGAAEMLFPELSDRGDVCLDRECFEKKLLPVVLAEIAAIKKRLAADPKAEPFFLIWENSPEYDSEASKSLPKCQNDFYFSREKKGKKENNAYLTWGQGAGTYCRVKPKGDYVKPINPKATAAGGTGGDSGDVKAPRTLEDRENELSGKRKRFAVENLREDMRRNNDGFPPPEETTTILRLLAVFGYKGEPAWYGKTLAESVELLKQDHKSNESLIASFWKDIQSTIRERLAGDIGGTLDTVHSDRAETFCELLGVNWVKLYWEPAVAAIPASKALLKARDEAHQNKSKK